MNPGQAQRVSFGPARPGIFDASQPPLGGIQRTPTEPLRVSSGAFGQAPDIPAGDPRHAFFQQQNQYIAQQEAAAKAVGRSFGLPTAPVYQPPAPVYQPPLPVYQPPSPQFYQPVATGYQPSSPQFYQPVATGYQPSSPQFYQPAPQYTAPSRPPGAPPTYNFFRGGKRTTQKRRKTRKHGSSRVRRHRRGHLSRRKTKA